MLKLNRKPSPFLLFPLTLLLVFFLAFPWVSAKEAPKPKPQDWQINGILAALDDGYPEVQILGFDKIREYELKDFDKRQAESIAEKAVKLLKDEKVDSYTRASAAEALGNIRQLKLKEIPIILNIIYERNQSKVEEWRFYTYFLGGGTEEVKTHTYALFTC